ncbi:MAG: MBL fold metallo-hydrolase [Woeseiaceae bacterium]|nr:MBL fold metallo-hydrolase [Woeseiaceae bacterium]
MTAFGKALPRLAELVPGVRRLVAPNPSLMTGPGTNTYLLGAAEITVLDPGPALPEHVDAIIAAAGAPIRQIVVTHTHPDHSPATRLLAERTGAVRIGLPAPTGRHQDRTFRPDREPADGAQIAVGHDRLEAVHTPGHASNHVCYRHTGLDWLFTGDHVIEGSTVVIDPPDGNMQAYLDSLARCRDLDCALLAPGHGDLIREPRRVIDWIIAHRLERETKVLEALRRHPDRSAADLVPKVYADVAAHLFPVAERSLLAHLEKLAGEGRARQHDDGRWRPA